MRVNGVAVRRRKCKDEGEDEDEEGNCGPGLDLGVY
jgi:hypothetical protein